jgi:hypothetical protein
VGEFCCDELREALDEGTVKTTSDGELYALTDAGRLMLAHCPRCGEQLIED